MDFDGTVASGAADLVFRNALSAGACKDDALAVFTAEAEKGLSLNLGLLTLLEAWKAEGHDLYLWTNRGPELAKTTLNDLGEYANLFSDFFFCDGKKKSFMGQGLFIDNEAGNLVGRNGLLVTFP